ncbi:MAG: hypothetical protein IPK19_20390 [Chloroflexi bacterium]|nr:hypothetical protein [Chloroflexota bacterium]
MEPELLKSLLSERQPYNPDDQSLSRRSSDPNGEHFRTWTLDSDRYQTWEGVGDNARILWSWLVMGKGKKLRSMFGLVFDETTRRPPSVAQDRMNGQPLKFTRCARPFVAVRARGTNNGSSGRDYPATPRLF